MIHVHVEAERNIKNVVVINSHWIEKSTPKCRVTFEVDFLSLYYIPANFIIVIHNHARSYSLLKP